MNAASEGREEKRETHRPLARRRLAIASIALAVCAGALVTVRPLPAAAAPTVYYFHGTANDDGCRAQVFAGTSQPCAFFDTTFPTQTTATGFTQSPGAVGNANQSANLLSVYWYGSFSGTASGAIYFDWYWSGASGAQTWTITVFSDPSPLIATTNTQIAQVGVTLQANPTPNLNHTVVPLNASCPCAVANHLLIQATNTGTGAGTANYDSTVVPSDFFFGPAPVTQVSTATVGPGPQGFANYEIPPGLQNRDVAQRQNAGEPSIGSDWVTGKIMDMAGTQVTQIGFDTAKPPNATWNDVTTAQLANLSEDSILFTNSEFNPSTTANRTWAEDFLLNPGCNANMAFTDNDGGSGGGPSGANTTTSWTPEQCPATEGPDHPSVGAGPYHGGAPVTAIDTNEIVYYCSQNVLNAAGAECTHSENGGLTWLNSVPINGALTPCGAGIHGHIRISPDGTMYVPNARCSGHQGAAFTTTNGMSFSYTLVTDATSGDTDPSIASDRAGNLYFGYQGGTNNAHPKIAISHNGGTTWGPSTDVGTPFGIQNTVFSEVIAGDAGRAAFAFEGTSTAGNYQEQTFRGVWYLYMAFTYDGGNSWQVVNASQNPVQRGCIDTSGVTGAYPGCRNQLDFNDITVDKQGRVHVAYTDGCTDSTNVPDANRMAGNPPAVVPVYNCRTNTTVNDTNCATSPGGQTFSEGASEYSYPTCTYGRNQALVRQVCGQGLFVANDPGFFESPNCAAPTGVPETALLGGFVGTGAAVIGLAAVIRRRRAKRYVPELN